MIGLILLVLNLLAALFKSKSRLEAENAALRQQLVVLRRKVHGRVRLTRGDRLFLVQLYRWFPSILKVITIVRPETLEHFPKRLNRGIPQRERIGFKVRAGMEASMDGEAVFGGSACARRWGGTGWRYHPGNGGATWSEYQLCRALP
jgi:hypothetical protein